MASEEDRLSEEEVLAQITYAIVYPENGNPYIYPEAWSWQPQTQRLTHSLASYTFFLSILTFRIGSETS
jgi:hypothetical protein